jgi:hypothetical protein
VLGLVEVAVLERGLEVEQAGRHFHRERRRRRGLRGLGLLHRGLELGGERLAEREQAPQRIADERELLGEAGEAVHLAAGDRLPRFLRRRDALLGVGDDGRIEAAEDAVRVVGRRRRRRSRRPRAPRRGAARGCRARRALTGAEEEDVAGEPLGDVGVAALRAGGTARAGATRRAW